ncbi:hypothetical protein [Pseudomonas sp. NPDC089401]|uniref:hypothetical protein n=1 Tax=Pseudomonas sp. NPDC089401 TaxID=3364462 RepID=UPI003819E766
MAKLVKSIREPEWDAGLVIADGAENILAPLVHETRHWIDMNCSIRGLATLKAIFRLLENPDAGNAAIKTLKRDISLNHFIERSVKQDLSNRYPWQVDFSHSVPNHHERIEHISLCFFGKADRTRSNVLFKSPVYLGSLLETCAVYQEQRDVLPLFLQEGLPHGARREAEGKALMLMQDSTAPEYHAITHAVSIAARQPEGAHGISLAAGICTLLLNMPPQMLKESCRRVENGLGKKRYGNGAVVAAEQMRLIAGVSPEAALIHNAVAELAHRSHGGSLPFSDDLIFDLVAFWRKRQAEFFERSHDHFVSEIKQIKGPDYFHSAIPALIENNRWLMEQRTLAFTQIGLPKRPPIILGDDFILSGDEAFGGMVPNWHAADHSKVIQLLAVQELTSQSA